MNPVGAACLSPINSTTTPCLHPSQVGLTHQGGSLPRQGSVYNAIQDHSRVGTWPLLQKEAQGRTVPRPFSASPPTGSMPAYCRMPRASPPVLPPPYGSCTPRVCYAAANGTPHDYPQPGKKATTTNCGCQKPRTGARQLPAHHPRKTTRNQTGRPQVRRDVEQATALRPCSPPYLHSLPPAVINQAGAAAARVSPPQQPGLEAVLASSRAAPAGSRCCHRPGWQPPLPLLKYTHISAKQNWPYAPPSCTPEHTSQPPSSQYHVHLPIAAYTTSTSASHSGPAGSAFL